MGDGIICEKCQKRYVWKDKYANKKVKCACGLVMVMPASDPAGTLQALTGESAATAPTPFELLLEQPSAVMRHAKTNPAQAAADDDDQGTFELAHLPEDGASQPPRPSNAYLQAMSSRPSAVAQALMNREDDASHSTWRDRMLPAMVAILGIVTQIILWFVFQGASGKTAGHAALMLLAEAVVLAPVAVLAVFIVARLMDIGFGPAWPAIIKIVAIAIGAGGVGDILFFKMMLSVDFDYQILLVGFVLHMILIGIPVAIIFELEAMEMAAIVAIIVAPRLAILYGMGVLLPHWF